MFRLDDIQLVCSTYTYLPYIYTPLSTDTYWVVMHKEDT